MTAYLVDAAIAAIGAKSITAKMGAAAALYFKSGKKLPDATLADMVKDVSSDPMSILKVLASVVDAVT